MRTVKKLAVPVSIFKSFLKRSLYAVLFYPSPNAEWNHILYDVTAMDLVLDKVHTDLNQVDYPDTRKQEGLSDQTAQKTGA